MNVHTTECYFNQLISLQTFQQNLIKRLEGNPQSLDFQSIPRQESLNNLKIKV